ncbi:hypothetical protein DERP_010481, partial [Dermatophagoides pteronyssinus]
MDLIYNDTIHISFEYYEIIIPSMELLIYFFSWMDLLTLIKYPYICKICTKKRYTLPDLKLLSSSFSKQPKLVIAIYITRKNQKVKNKIDRSKFIR